jgi:hypothetical protein
MSHLFTINIGAVTFSLLVSHKKDSMIMVSPRRPCVSVCQLLEKLIDFHETNYECYVTSVYPTVELLQFSIISDHNMTDVQTLEVAVTLGTLRALKCHLLTSLRIISNFRYNSF